MRFSWAAATDSGLRRDRNEDSYCAREDLGLFVVADGMGGHVAGEVASRLAVESIETFITDTRASDSNDTWPFPLEPSISFEANRLKSAFRVANRHIGAKVESARGLRGMATTASALLIGPTSAVVAHVGDSRVYLMRGGTLQRLTRDHSWVEEQVRAGTLDAKTARQHPWRNVVTRALSGGDDPGIDVGDVRLEPGDRLLLCSDGLYTVLSDDRIEELLRGSELPEVCRALVSAANQGGGPDNVTTLVLQIDAP